MQTIRSVSHVVLVVIVAGTGCQLSSSFSARATRPGSGGGDSSSSGSSSGAGEGAPEPEARRAPPGASHIQIGKVVPWDGKDEDLFPYTGKEESVGETHDGPVLIDLDGDRDLDLLARTDGPGWIENRGGRKWQARSVSQDRLIGLAAGDLDGDGDADLIGTGTGRDGRGLGWWENLGKAKAWQDHTITADGEWNSVAVGDLDGDGDPDLVGGSKPFGWYENRDGKGTEWSAKQIIAEDFYAAPLFLLDMDGDEDLDIVTGQSDDGEFATHELLWFENAGRRWKKRVIDRGNGYRPITLQAIDWDRDGDLDLVVGGETRVAILENLGNGYFSPEDIVDSGNMIRSFAVRAGDIDGDKDLDLVVTQNGNDPNITWFEQDKTTFREHVFRRWSLSAETRYPMDAGDLDGDGDLDVVYDHGYLRVRYSNAIAND